MDRRDWIRLLVIAVVWLGLARLMALYGAPLLPRALAAQLTLQSFLSLVMMVATAVGGGLCFVLLKRPLRELGLTKPSFTAIGMASLAAPIVVAVSLYLAFTIALPTLLAEIAAGGRQAAQQNVGAFGRSLVQARVATVVLFATVITPLGEELIFRGAWWSAITGLTERWLGAPRSLPPELMRESAFARGLSAAKHWLLSGGLATLLTAALFAWMHADQRGGAGIVRVVQTACLGLALGTARHASGGLAAPIALHAVFNLLTLAKLRGWFVSPGWPKPLPIALLYWQLAAVAAVLLLLWSIHRLERARRVSARASVHVRAMPEAVFDLIIDPETIVKTFRGHGPIPAAQHAELISDGGMRIGAVRRVHNSDGSMIDEEIIELERPSRQAYRLTKGFAFPLSLLVSGAAGRWTLEQEGEGTHIDWHFTFELRSAFAWPIARLLRRPFATAMKEALARHGELLDDAAEGND